MWSSLLSIIYPMLLKIFEETLPSSHHLYHVLIRDPEFRMLYLYHVFIRDPEFRMLYLKGRRP